ncbi:921_t:CDS:1, partial [Gigaspora rosea]
MQTKLRKLVDPNRVHWLRVWLGTHTEPYQIAPPTYSFEDGMVLSN